MILLVILGKLNSRPAPIHLTQPNSPQRTIFRKMRQTQSVAKELSSPSTRTQYCLSIIEQSWPGKLSLQFKGS